MSKPDRRQTLDRRRVERRAPKRGVNIRHDDAHYVPKRVLRRDKDR